MPSDVALASTQGGLIAAEHLLNFPFPLAAVVGTAKDLEKDSFEHTLALIDRYAVVWAFWLQVYRTITALAGYEKTANLHQLYTILLSVTVEVRVGLNAGETAIWTVHRSEGMAAAEKCCRDSFVAFAQKISLIGMQC